MRGSSTSSKNDTNDRSLQDSRCAQYDLSGGWTDKAQYAVQAGDPSSRRPRGRRDGPRGVESPAHAREPGTDGPDTRGRPLTDAPLRDLTRRATEEIEERYLREGLVRFRGNVSQLASAAGLDRRSIFEKLKHYNLRREDFRRGAADTE